MIQKPSKKLSGKIEVLTGLHIGAGNDKVEIGGIDGPVIKNPLTREPYIPGSSIKGKMRALLEWSIEGKVKEYNGDPCKCGKSSCPICRVFGSANNSEVKTEIRGPTRLIIRDAVLDEESKKKFEAEKPIIEEKYENNINRIDASAGLRQMERVVPSVKFKFELVYRIFDMDDDKGKKDLELFDSVVIKGLKLLQNDFLGGGGSRGNGRIRFIGLEDNEGNKYQLG